VTRIFVDSSAWLAYLNRADKDHTRVRTALLEHAGKLITSSYVFDETVTLCLYRFGHAAAAQLGAHLQDPEVVQLVRSVPDDERAAWTLFLERPDKTYSFTDCLSFVLMRRLNTAQAAALDADFAREGFTVLPGG
jgi:uncharacterized protein